jgi:hypothetical protein
MQPIVQRKMALDQLMFELEYKEWIDTMEGVDPFEKIKEECLFFINFV